MELVRVADSVYADQARADFTGYVSRTLAASQAVGGRFNPPGEFGALYTASDEMTAWEEVAARFRREGVQALPPDMGIIGIIVPVGLFVLLTDADVRQRWDVTETELLATDPTSAQRESCWNLGRSVRAVADFLRSPSARASGAIAPLFADRDESSLRIELQYARSVSPPAHLRQTARESW